MNRTRSWWSPAPMAVVVATLLVAAGCGDLEVKSKADDKKADDKDRAPRAPRRTPAPVRATGCWASARPAAPTAETNITAYITYNPSTGQATARQLPGGPGREHHARAGAPCS